MKVLLRKLCTQYLLGYLICTCDSRLQEGPSHSHHIFFPPFFAIESSKVNESFLNI